MSDAPGTLPTAGGYAGSGWLLSGTSDLNALDFLIRQVVQGKAFAGLVKVGSVSGGGPDGRPPMLSVTPMVTQTDGLGNIYPHGTIYQIPAFRLQGGSTAIVLDPVAPDIGLAIICHRDHSNVKANYSVSAPGSRRENDWADGMYFGGFLNAAPTTYIYASDATGVQVLTPGGNYALTRAGVLTVAAKNWTVDAAGNAAFNGEVTWNNATTPTHASSHTHTQGDDSHGDTEVATNPPTAGT